MKSKNITMKRAFSLIEVIFVLVILGIVASISSQLIAQVYENYIMQRAVYNVSTKTELVANQIVNRLTYRIQGSTISKVHKRFMKKAIIIGDPAHNGGAFSNDDWISLSDLAPGTKYTTLEWIGYDNDSFSAAQNPYWSGISDYQAAGGASMGGFTSPGSNFASVATIMNNLSNSEVDLTINHPAALVFLENDNEFTPGNFYDQLCMGLIPEVENNTSCIFPVYSNGNDLNFTRQADPNNGAILPKIITDRYKLAWSAYAIAPEPNKNGSFDLYLYYNYQPWNGESYIDDGTKKMLMPNVTVFKFSENGGVINFKLCASENIGEDFNVTTCKEKVVIR